MKVSIIIRCYNEEEHIGKLLTGIFHQKNADFEVILVDSGSTDSTLFIASKFDVKVLKIRPEDFSFGYALNVGCAAASGDVLLFASAHVYPLYTDWLSLMAQPFINDEKVALVYGKQRGDYRNKFSEHQIFAQWFPEVSNYNQQIPFCNNANCAVRQSIWQTHKFDEQLTGLEDLMWAKQIQKMGYRIAYESKATIIHIHEENAAIISNRYKREAIALKKINPENTFTFIDFCRLLLINIVHDLKVAFKQGELLENLQDIFMFRYNQFLGTYNGYKETETSLSKTIRKKYYYPPSKQDYSTKVEGQDVIKYNE